MTLDALNYLTALPEIFLLCMACLVLVVDVFISDAKRDFSYFLSQVALLGTFVLVMTLPVDGRVVAFNNMFVQDAMSVVLKLFILLLSSVAFVYSRGYLKDRNIFKGEYYVLGLFAVLGMMLMVSANNLLMIYLGLELLSL
jgi:NADH-quinone oxidoreductase subunit N